MRSIHYRQLPKYTFQALSPIIVKKAPKEEYLAWVEKNPDVLSFVMSKLLARLSGAITRLQTILIGNAYQKVISAILFAADNLGVSNNGLTTINIPLTHQDIADMVALSRETVTVEIDQLKKQQLITVTNHRMSVSPTLRKTLPLF